jgi:ABC-type iron transport system FetAB ATPase subunit
VLLLDELTTYLDEADQRTVLEAVAQVVRGPRAVTAIWVTHRLEELRFADTARYTLLHLQLGLLLPSVVS